MDKERDSVYYLYIIDEDDKLVGVLSLKELLLSQDDMLLEEIAVKDIIFVREEYDQEEAAHLMAKYDLISLPVINQKRRDFRDSYNR